MLVTMSDKELNRINVIQSVVEKRMRRRDTAQLLGLTERQTQRLMNRFRESGAAGLANLRRATSTAFSGSIMVVQLQPALPSLVVCFPNWGSS